MNQSRLAALRFGVLCAIVFGGCSSASSDAGGSETNSGDGGASDTTTATDTAGDSGAAGDGEAGTDTSPAETSLPDDTVSPGDTTAGDDGTDDVAADGASGDTTTAPDSAGDDDSGATDGGSGDGGSGDSGSGDGGSGDGTTSDTGANDTGGAGCDVAACASSAPPCHFGACVADTCTFKAFQDGAPCNDDNVCTVNDACKAGTCVGGTVICACQKDADCVGKTGGGLCAGAEVCDPTSHKCVNDAATKVVCPTPSSPCMVATCNAKTGSCSESPVSGSKTCKGSDPCLATGFCQAGSCIQAVNLCECKTDGECETKWGVNLCKGKTYCDLAKPPYRCRVDATKAPLCPPSTPCKPSSCDAKTGTCSVAPLANGLSCSTDQACSSIGTCNGGTCNGSGTAVCQCKVAADCDDGSACTKDSCEGGACIHTPANEGGDCKDGDSCLLGGVCKAGTCEGASQRLWSLSVGEQGKDQFWGVRTIGPDDAILLRCTEGWDGEPFACYVTRHDVAGKQVWSTTLPSNLGGSRPGLVASGDATMVHTGDLFAQIAADGTTTWTVKPGKVGDRLIGLAPSVTAGGVVAAWYQSKTSTGVAAAVGLIEVDAKGVAVKKVEELVPTKKVIAHGIATASDGYLVVGSELTPKSVSWILKVDTSGKELWQVSAYNTSVSVEAVAVLPSGEIWVGDVGVQRFTASGEKLPGSLMTSAIKKVDVIVPLADGALIAGSDQGKAAIQRIGLDLTGRAPRLFFGPQSDTFHAAALTTNQHVLVAGINVSDGKGYGDAVAMRLDAFGNQGCGGSGTCFAKGPSACDDGAPCTADDCTGAKGCSFLAAPTGTPCGSGLTCSYQAVCK